MSAAGFTGGPALRDYRQPIAALLTLGLTALGAPAVLAQTSANGADLWQRNTLTGDWGGLRTGLENDGVTLGLQQQSEIWGNLKGGLKQGVAYDGLLTASLAVDLDKAVHWQGASLFASGFQIQGVGPTALLVGALQTISNLEATRSAKLYDLWLEQQLFAGKFSLRIGQEGANDEFMISQYGALFINSSFGFPPVPSLDLPSGGPNYPLATPFLRAQFQPTNQVTFLGAVYNGDPAPPGTGDPQLRDLHGTAFRLDDHTLSFAELWYSPSILAKLGQPGTYKVGMWIATGPFADPLTATDGLSLANPASNGEPLQHATDRAFYAVIDQMIWKKPNTVAQGIGLFVQIMHAPEDRNLSDLYVEGGLNWKGIIPSRSHDAAGLAVAHAGISGSLLRFSNDMVLYTGSGTPYSPGETVIEATYRARLAPWFKVQPDLQYVIDPGAGIPTAKSAAPLKNALVLGVRVTINF